MKHNIINQIGAPAALEQLAEESAELSKAALKLARVIRAENPTPVSRAEAVSSLKEELGDVRLCIRVIEDALGKLDTQAGEEKKLWRWKRRLLLLQRKKDGKAKRDENEATISAWMELPRPYEEARDE